ncbi:uncharacterized protein [Phaenicophaeus curvirostris]|uniref:uncharacterized protein n=1 Tax=Phaenicophaeus curvirostris TaxID=33595 RepID=UPI0037F0F069
MGNQVCSPERDVYELRKALLQKHGKNISVRDLKVILKWVQAKIPTVTASTVFTRELWDDVGVKLWDATIEEKKGAKKLGAPWQKVFEVLKAHVGLKKQSDNFKPSAGSSTTVLTPHPPKLAALASATPNGRADYPFDPGPIDNDKELDPPPHCPSGQRVQARREAQQQGEVEILQALIRAWHGGPRWELISDEAIKEIPKNCKKRTKPWCKSKWDKNGTVLSENQEQSMVQRHVPTQTPPQRAAALTSEQAAALTSEQEPEAAPR